MVASLPAKASGAPQQDVYASTYKSVTAHVECDESFAKVKGAIESHLGLLQKQAQVKVRNWLKKLSEEVSASLHLQRRDASAPPHTRRQRRLGPLHTRVSPLPTLQTANVVWKKNRNAYARLLLEQLRSGRLGEPFGALPPGGPLPTLPKHLAYAFTPARPGGTTAAPAGGAASLAQHSHAPQQQQQQQQQQHSQLSATEQLDEYLGRADFRRAQFAEEQAAAAGAAAAAGSEAGGAQYLPGTRMQLRGAEARKADRCGCLAWLCYARMHASHAAARAAGKPLFLLSLFVAMCCLLLSAGTSSMTWHGSPASWSLRRSWAPPGSGRRSWSGGWAAWKACCASTRSCWGRAPASMLLWDRCWTPLTTATCRRRAARCAGWLARVAFLLPASCLQIAASSRAARMHVRCPPSRCQAE